MEGSRVAISGSFRGRGRADPETEAAFRRACRELGAALARRGLRIVVCSASEATADRHVVDGARTFMQARGHLPKTPPIIWVLEPSARHEDDYYDALVEQVPGLIETRPVHQARRRDSTTSRRYAPQLHIRALEESDAVLLIAGAGGTTAAARAAILAKLPLVPVGCFGGAASWIAEELSGGADESARERGRLVGDHWTEASADTVASCLDSATGSAPSKGSAFSLQQRGAVNGALAVGPHAIAIENLNLAAPWIAAAAGAAPQHESTLRIDELRARLRNALDRIARLQSAGKPTSTLETEVRGLRRRMREGIELAAGDSFGAGRYVITELLGRGGFANVWLAKDLEQRRDVAVKILHPSLMADSVMAERFRRGARVMKSLEHAHIVRLLTDAVEEDSLCYFTMEHATAGDLREFVLREKPSNEDVVSLVTQVGEALSFAHAQGLVHRDVKPRNILLQSPILAQLADFDLVTGAELTAGTLTGGAFGTFLFNAPEIFRGASSADGRADVYSLAMTTLFCLFGEDLPLEAIRDVDAIIAQLKCGTGIKSALRRGLEWNVDHRHQTVQDFCDDLARPSPATSKMKSPALDADSLTGAEFPGGFIAQSVVAVGGMSVCYEATRAHTGEKVMLRVFRRSVLDDARAPAAFRQWRLALRRIKHPNCATVLDSGIHEGFAYVTTERISHPRLSDLVDTSAPFSWGDALSLSLQVLSAIGEVHGAGLIHGTLSSKDVVVGSDRRHSRWITLVDFGVPEAISRRPGSDALFRYVVPEFAAPEQRFGLSGRSADLFACGRLIGCAIGCIPETGEPLDAEAVRLKHAVAIATSERAEQRYDSAEAFAAAIRHGAVR